MQKLQNGAFNSIKFSKKQGGCNMGNSIDDVMDFGGGSVTKKSRFIGI